MSFDKNWIKIIKLCICSPYFSIAVNGALYGFFKRRNGLRQGDPISPSSFVLMAESLSRHITKLREVGIWKGITIHNE